MKRTVYWIMALALLLCGCAGGRDFPAEAGRIEALTGELCQEIGSREAGSDQERQACGLLERELLELGFSYDDGSLVHSSFLCLDGRESENLMAVCNAGAEGPIVAVTAHYDSVPASPGAGDNAVSVAILMEIARLLGRENPDFPGQVRLLFLGAEETGYHGSRSYVENLSGEERQHHLACFNMDISAAVSGGAVLVCNTLGGWTEEGYQEGNFLSPVENRVSRAVSQAWSELYGGGFGGVFHVGESDQVSFHNGEIDAANVCWRELKNDLPSLPATYHRPEDTEDTLDYATAVQTCRCVLRGVQIVLEQGAEP